MKTFFILPARDLTAGASIVGTVTEARAAISGDGFQVGDYRILEDTSGIVTKAIESTPKVKVTFEASRKRPRKAKAEDEPKKGKK